MNTYLILAASLILIVALVHSILGEKLIIHPTLKLDLPKVLGTDFFVKRTLRFAWHILTIVWFGIAAIVFYFSTRALGDSDRFVLLVIALTYAVSFIVSLIGAKGRHLSWLAFLIIALLTWKGASL